PALANTMAEAVLTWVLYLHRKIPTYVTQQQQKIWKQHAYTATSQCKVGLLGLGELGKASAHRLTSNGFEVLGWSQSKKILSNVKSYHGEKGLVEMLEHCQIVICLLPLTKTTRGLVNKKLLEHLPSGASLINFSRGEVVVVKDLLSQLNTNRLAHAVLDVFEQEPLPKDSELWGNKRISILPHIAATTNPESAAQIIANNISNFRNKGSLDEFIDLDRGY
ncbi:MAG: NAD(P)-binding domain-containing protein, partial [Kangiellaceae bacterium]|nr:NAD(P)-binding domain-containing protein [Kangiellaceae bacterium]